MNIKKLVYQSCHRGCKETDIILGSFAKARLSSLTHDELDDYAKLLEVSDSFIYDWIAGRKEIPEEYNTSVLRKCIEFSLQRARNE